jgi:16S rRNA (uracil1498-N3)-methyltransferase
MRVREGDELRLFAGDGREWRAVVRAVTKGKVHVTVGEVARQEAPPALVVEAWCALVRPNRFDWALEKCVEAGADVIRPLLTERTGRGDGSSAAKVQRWERIAVEAAEQCGRLFLPVIERAATLTELLARQRVALLMGDPEGATWAETIPLLPLSGRVVVAVGPEGGFSEEETALARSKGALAVRFGPNVLRTETAAVVGVALVRSALQQK